MSHTAKNYVVKFRFIKGLCPSYHKSQLGGGNFHFVITRRGKLKILTSLDYRNYISGLCCHNGAGEENIHFFFYCQKFVFESCYGTEANKLISLLFWLSVLDFLVCSFCEAGWLVFSTLLFIRGFE